MKSHKFKVGDKVSSVSSYFYSGAKGIVTKLGKGDFKNGVWVKIQEFESKPYDNPEDVLFADKELELIYQVEGFEV